MTIQIKRFVGVLGALILCGPVQIADAGLRFSSCATIWVQAGCWAYCPTDGEGPFIRHRPYRGAIDGGGGGFVEEEIDVEPADGEILTSLDIAHGLLSGQLSRSGVGVYSGAKVNESVLQAFETHLSDYPEDWYTMREFAIALILDQRYERGFKELIESYVGEPSLVRIPLNKFILGTEMRAMGKLAERMVRYARSNDSDGAWFVVSILLQSRGEDGHALTNLERSIGAGLDEQLGVSMRKALTEN